MGLHEFLARGTHENILYIDLRMWMFTRVCVCVCLTKFLSARVCTCNTHTLNIPQGLEFFQHFRARMSALLQCRPRCCWTDQPVYICMCMYAYMSVYMYIRTQANLLHLILLVKTSHCVCMCTCMCARASVQDTFSMPWFLIIERPHVHMLT
jgi:hypothetical protein